MFCSNCGASLVPGQNFCSKCGQQVVAEVKPPAPELPIEARSAPLPPAQSRIEKHTKILAILWLVISIVRLVPAFGLWFGSGIGMHFVPFPMRALFWPIAGVIGAFLFATSIAGLLAGWGLLNYRPWARMLTLVLGVIALIHVPFGTALGIYTLWVLLPAESEREYRRLARTAY
jgi:apolipoprotein N-acyltransferase